MPRPKSCYQIGFRPKRKIFKPAGIPAKDLALIELNKEELEALKLHDVDGLDQTKAAAKMGISQPTFGRILDRGYKKVAKALVEGKGLRLE